MAKDFMKAKEIVGKFVLEAPYSAYWESMIRELIEPLDLHRFGPLDEDALCKAAAAGIRDHWPKGCNDRAAWESRSGPWCRSAGINQILETVEKTALRMSQP